jgi:hypothetical protein
MNTLDHPIHPLFLLEIIKYRDQLMTILEKIDLDLEDSLIRLHFKDNKSPLLISFTVNR